VGDYLLAMAHVVTEAISSARSVFFFDELDTFGSRGGNADNRKTQYWTSIINDFLHQLTCLNVATNSPEKNDPAITRSGRFNIKIIRLNRCAGYPEQPSRGT